VSSTYRKLAQEEPNLVLARFAKDVFLGLLRTRKVLSSKYMYDLRGSNLYEEIMRLPEYYLVESEYNCLLHAKNELAELLSEKSFNLIELGPGNGYKTKILLEYFLKENLDFTYIPVDISENAMKGLIGNLNEEFPQLKTEGLVADYFDALEEIRGQNENVQNVVLFLGSNIGNFSFDNAVDFIFTEFILIEVNFPRTIF